MKRYVLVVSVGLSPGVGLATGWLLERKRDEQKPAPTAIGSSEKQEPSLDCEHASESDWYTVRIFDYEPSKTPYTANWETCEGDPIEQRIRITDANLQKVFFKFENDEVERVETLDLLGNHVPQLLVLTMSSGTGDDIEWHVIGESNGALKEWKPPDYDGPAGKLLRPDEDFGYKDWNFHIQGNEILLARGIYQKDDGNCCPSRGGVLVRLRPIDGGFKVVTALRISKPEYFRWRDTTFCLDCKLY